MKTAEIRRIAVLRNDRLGDLVCTLPLLEALRQGFPQAHVTAIVSPESAPLLVKHPDVDELLPADKRMPVRELAQLLRAGRYDAVLLVRCSGRQALAAFLSRVPIRVAHGRQWFHALCATHRFYKSRRHPPLHEADYALSFAERLGIPFSVEQANPRLVVDPTLRAAMLARITAQVGSEGPLLGVHPGNRGSAYNWAPERYLQTIIQLAAAGRVVITGSPYDQTQLDWITQRIDPALRSRVMTLTDTTLPQLVATLSLLDGFLSSSTGPLHIASIVSRAAVGLYSDVSYLHPIRWQPIGANISILLAHSEAKEPPAIGSPEADAVMAQISVDAVVESMLAKVNRSSAA